MARQQHGEMTPQEMENVIRAGRKRGFGRKPPAEEPVDRMARILEEQKKTHPGPDGFHWIRASSAVPPLACDRCGALIEEDEVDKHREFDNMIVRMFVALSQANAPVGPIPDSLKPPQCGGG